MATLIMQLQLQRKNMFCATSCFHLFYLFDEDATFSSCAYFLSLLEMILDANAIGLQSYQDTREKLLYPCCKLKHLQWVVRESSDHRELVPWQKQAS